MMSNIRKKHNNTFVPSANPYIGQPRHPGLARLLEAADQRTPGGGDPTIVAPPVVEDTGINRPRATLASQPPAPPSGAAAGEDDGGKDIPAAGIYDFLAKLHPNAIITLSQLARAWKLSERTIRRYVNEDKLPPSMKIGRAQQWLVGVLIDWLRDEAKRKAEEAAAHRRHILSKTE